ncbi:hypothetical protein [Clostridium sp. UBA4548]|uniref:hypothetical protein n=1 Tax=Clostridium sp. UBA4548 TaxID=1946361 RepID=UPI0025C531FF|nr:hypothetical protein [Clostridium sp. UBA4548]
MPYNGETKYFENVVNAMQSRNLRDKCLNAASDVNNLGILAMKALVVLPPLAVGVMVMSAVIQYDFKAAGRAYSLANDLMDSGRFINAKVAQKYQYKRVKSGGDYFESWYAIEAPKVVALQYANGKWETDPSYLG